MTQLAPAYDIAWKRNHKNQSSHWFEYQLEFLQDFYSPTAAVFAAAGTGKTFMAIAKHIQLSMINGSPSPHQFTQSAYVMPTFPQATKVAVNVFRAFFNNIESKLGRPILNHSYGTDGYNGSVYAYKLLNNHLIYMFSADRPNSLHGPDLTHWTADEVARWRTEESYDIMVMRGRAPEARVSQINIITSPETGHWSHYRIYDDAERNNTTVYQNITLDMNQAVSPADKQRALDQLSERQYSQMAMGQFLDPKGLVFSSFKRDTHVIPYKYRPGDRVYIGFDFGKSNAAAVFLAEHPFKDNAYIVFDEMIFKEIWYQDVVKIIQDHVNSHGYNIEDMFPDPNDRTREAKRQVRIMRNTYDWPVTAVCGYYERDQDTGLDLLQTAVKRWDDRDGNSIRLYVADSMVDDMLKRRKRRFVRQWEDTRKRGLLDMFEKMTYKTTKRGEVFTGVLNKWSDLKHIYDALKFAAVHLYPDIFEKLKERREARMERRAA